MIFKEGAVQFNRQAGYLWLISWTPSKINLFAGRLLDIFPALLFLAIWIVLRWFEVEKIGVVSTDWNFVLRILGWNYFITTSLMPGLEFSRNQWLMKSAAGGVYIILILCLYNFIFYTLFYCAISFFVLGFAQTMFDIKGFAAVMVAFLMMGGAGLFIGFLMLPLTLMNKHGVRIVGALFLVIFFLLPIVVSPLAMPSWAAINPLAYPFAMLWNIKEKVQVDWLLTIFCICVIFACVFWIVRKIFRIQVFLSELIRNGSAS